MIIDDISINAELVDIIQELKRQLEINNIHLFSKIKESGDNIQVCCPYHNNGQERRPSAGFRKDTGIFHCFACNETHSLTEVISNCFGKNDYGVFGLQWLVKNFATTTIENRQDIKLNFSRNEKTEQPTYISEEELDSYRYTHTYWAKRGITSNELIELFDLGFDTKTQCITFPIRDVNGNCVFVARRSVNQKYFNYPVGTTKPIYGYYEMTKLKEFPKTVVICESMLDALSFWQIGEYAVALNGLGSSYQYQLLSNMPCRKFILCTDNDIAGMNARKTLRANIKNKLITEYVLPTNRKDANECTQEELKNLKEIF